MNQPAPPPPPNPSTPEEAIEQIMGEDIDGEGQAIELAPPTATEKRFPCAQCGAKLTYRPGTINLTCEYCGHVNHIPQSEDEIKEIDFFSTLESLATQTDTMEAIVTQCNSCGAETTLEPGVTACECPFCGAEVVATGKAKRLIKPAGLLPFHLDRKSARDAYAKWLQGLWFAPNKVKKFARTDGKFTGMYVPFWTYDSNTTSFYRGQRGDNYTTTTRVNGKTVTRTKTRWRSASGTVWREFDDVLILGSTSVPRKYADELEPWDLENLVPYQDEFLSGFRSEAYHIDLPAGFEFAKDVMDEKIRADIRKDIGGDKQRIHSVNTQHDDITFKHILLPIWIGAFRYQEKVYQIVINARTGEVQGERPWSWVKISLAVLGALILIGLILFGLNSAGAFDSDNINVAPMTHIDF